MEEEENIETEYEIWKTNVPYLYSQILSQPLEWPSLTLQFLRYFLEVSLSYRTEVEKDHEYNILLGTHTDGQQNYLMTVHCTLDNEKGNLLFF